MNRLTTARRCAVVNALVEGNSVRSTVRMTGVAKNTVSRLLTDIGHACHEFSDAVLHDLPCSNLQVDEIWSYVGMKNKNVPEEREGEWGVGDVWTWTAICADTKLIPCWHLGRRDGAAARRFILDLTGRMRGRIHLTSDGHRPYLRAVEAAFGGAVDYAMLVKVYGSDAVPELPQRRYSPGEFVTARKVPVQGTPVDEKISTSYVERQNLTMRMRMRRFTRLTNGFSKSVEKHWAALALHFCHYNFVRRHESLRVTPAMAAGVVDQLWSVEDLVQILEQREAREAAESGSADE